MDNEERYTQALKDLLEQQKLLGEVLTRVIDTAEEQQKAILKIKEAKVGLDEFFDKYDEYHYQRYGGSFRKMFNSPK